MQEASAIWWADLEQKHILWCQNRRRWRWQKLAHSRRASIFQALFQKWPAYRGCANSWYHPEHDKTPPSICRQICISPPKLWNGYHTMQQLNNSPRVLLVACLQEEHWMKNNRLMLLSPFLLLCRSSGDGNYSFRTPAKSLWSEWSEIE